MKNILAKFSLVTLSLTIIFTVNMFASENTTSKAAVPPTKIDIYPTNWQGNPIPNKVFTISPTLPNGSNSVTSGPTRARIYVSNSCSTSSLSSPCMNKNVYYTISGGSCFTRLRIRFYWNYSWKTEPSIQFSEYYDGNEGFSISGGSNYYSWILPRTSQYPCG